MYFDSHAHLDDERFQKDFEEILARMKHSGVTAMMNIGCDLPSSENSVRLAETYPWVWAAVGSHPDDVNAYAASSFFAVDRYASYKTDWGRFYEEGGVVIADRYTTSNAVHQCSKLPPEQWEAFLHWLFDYEFHLLGLPAPDSVIYLQVDPAVSQRLMTARYHGDESKKDVHEKDTEYLARSRRAAEYCAEHLGWTTVHCTHSDAMRSIEDIQTEVQGIVLGQLK